MKKTVFLLSTLALLTACNQESKAPAKPAPPSVQATLVPQTPPTDSWVGKWIGVEGLHLTIAKDDIAFTRPDGPQQLRAGDGAATGLKWLADKKNCLIVATGEGYCR